MNKQVMMDNFDEMNTAGLSSQKLLECAQKVSNLGILP